MAVNSIDYAKELSRLRNQYQKSTEENRKTYEDDKVRMEEVSEARHEKALDTFKKGKREIEELFDERISEIRDNTKELIDKSRTDYLEKLDKERHSFEKAKVNQKNQYNKQIREIGDSFRRANNQEKEEHKIIQENAQENQARRIKTQANQHMKEIDLITQRSKKVDEETKKKNTEEQEELYKKHQIELQDTKKEEVNRRLQDVAKKEEENKLLKEFFTNEIDLKERMNADNVDTIKRKNADNVFRMQESFEDLSNDMRRKAVLNEENSRREYGDKLKEQSSISEKEKSFLNKRIHEISRAKNADEETRKGVDLKSADEDRLERYNQNLDNIRKDFHKKNEEARDSYLSDLDKTKFESEKKLTQQKLDSGRELVQQNAKSAKDRNDMIDTYKRQNTETSNNFERLLVQKERFNNQRINDSILDFNHQVNDINDRSYDSLKKLREEYSTQKKEFIAKSEIERAEMAEELKRTFGNKLEDSSRQNEQRLKQKNKELKNTVSNYESTIRALKEARVKNDRYREFLYKEKRKEDLNEWRDYVKEKDNQHAKLVDNLRSEYETKIDELQNAHVAYVKKMVGAQNDIITRMQTEKMIELKRAEKLNQKEQHRLKTESQVRLDQQKFSYEDKIKQVKDNYEYEIRKLKNKIDSMGG